MEQKPQSINRLQADAPGADPHRTGWKYISNMSVIPCQSRQCASPCCIFLIQDVTDAAFSRAGVQLRPEKCGKSANLPFFGRSFPARACLA
jgi:hypothetical protein